MSNFRDQFPETQPAAEGLQIIWSITGMKGGVRYAHTQKLFNNDGGRSRYFVGSAGDCVTRAIAIATGIDYKVVYDAMFDGIENLKENGRGRYVRNLRRKKAGSRGTTPRNGVHPKIYKKFLEALGWVWVPTMTIGSGCKVHLRGDELPKGRIIVRVSKHVVAMIDGVVHDTYDCTRGGSRCVYGYFYNPDPESQIISLESNTMAMHEVMKVIEKKRPHFLKKLSSWHKEEIIHMIDNRLETIEDDPLSADTFETLNTLNLLRDKVEADVEPVFTREEKKWLQEELGNAESIGILKADKLIEYIKNH